MRPEDWERAEELFHRLAPLGVAERSELLDEVSSTEPDLADDVRSLLSAHDSDGPLDRLTAKLAPEAPGAGLSVAPLTGTSISHYEVGKLIGRGGMGDVYRARDTRLDRDVALKFLPAWLGRDPSARDRFLVEARIVSSIDHPNVCTLFDIGETDDGRLFLVMPFYRGETLKQRLKKGPLSDAEALEVSLQVTRGLAAAHERGVVHRDVKPGNLLLAEDGRVKILDFGVAKLADVSLTRPGETPGTERYMAPEQAAGGAVDARADLWALGAVMYEMLTGGRPAGSVDSDVDGSTPLMDRLADTPRGLAETVLRLLATRPDERYPDARALAEDLEVLGGGPGSLSASPAPSLKRFLAELKRRRVFRVAAVYGVAGFAVIEAADMIFPRVPLPEWTVSLVVWLVLLGFPIALVLAWAFEVTPRGVRRTRAVRPAILDAIAAQPAGRRWPIGMAGLVGGALIVGGAWLTLGRSSGSGVNGGAITPPESPAEPGIAVLPFEAIGLDPLVWQRGIVDLLSFNLDGVQGIRKIDPMAIMRYWDETGATGRNGADVATGLRIGRETGASHAVLGSAVKLGDAGTVRLTANVYDVNNGDRQGSAYVDGQADSLPSLVDALVVALLRSGLLPVTGAESPIDLRRITTASLPALQAYLAGEDEYRRGHFEEAMVEFQRAVDLDSTFARALYRLEGARTWVSGGVGDPANWKRAEALAAGLPERDSLLLSLADLNTFSDWGPRIAATFERLTSRYPDDADGWYNYGEYLWHFGGLRFEAPAAYRGAFERSIAVAPHYAEAYIHLIEDAFARLDSADIRRLIEAAERVDPEDVFCRDYQIASTLRWGSQVEREQALAAIDSLPLAEQVNPCGWVTIAAAPAFADSAEKIQLVMLGQRFSLFENWIALWRLLQTRLMRGQPAGARRLIARAADNPEIRNVAAMHWTMMDVSGYPDGSDFGSRDILAAEPPSSRYFGLSRFWLGADAIHDDDPDALEGWLAELDSLPVSEDDTDARIDAAYGQVLREFAAIANGDWSRLEPFEQAERGLHPASYVREFPAMYLRYEVGRMLLDAGRAEEAERYFLSLYPYAWTYYVPAQFHLGRIYEQLGETAKAREHYRILTEWWETADPELQPWREEGLEALRRLVPDA